MELPDKLGQDRGLSLHIENLKVTEATASWE